MCFPWIIMLFLQAGNPFWKIPVRNAIWVILVSSEDDVSYILSTRDASDVKLRAEDVLQTNLELGKTILVIHGWTETPNLAHYVKIKDEYLKKYNCTVLRVDWSNFGNGPYNEATSKVQSLGKVKQSKAKVKLFDHEIHSR